jgi:hypothetical protein
LSRIARLLFSIASNSDLSISIALCCAYAMACIYVVCYTSTYTFGVLPPQQCSFSLRPYALSMSIYLLIMPIYLLNVSTHLLIVTIHLLVVPIFLLTMPTNQMIMQTPLMTR